MIPVEKIQEVIEDFDKKHQHHLKRSKNAVSDETKYWNEGVTEAFDYVLSKLRTVAESENNYTRNPTKP